MSDAEITRAGLKWFAQINARSALLQNYNNPVSYHPYAKHPLLPSFFFSVFLFQYPAALMNLGAILHLNGKLTEAEANYLRALQLKPDDVITQSNLRKLWNIMERQGLRTKRELGMQKGDV